MRGLSKDRCFILLFAVSWCLAQDAVISSQICISWPMLVVLVEVPWNVAGTSALLKRNIRLELQVERTDGCLSSEPLSNSFTQLFFFFFLVSSFTSPARSRLKYSWSVCLGWNGKKTFADEFFGEDSSKPALLSVQYQIQQMFCFCHNSLSDHLDLIFHFPDLSISSSSYSTPTVDAHSPTALACTKVIAETYTLGLDSC